MEFFENLPDSSEIGTFQVDVPGNDLTVEEQIALMKDFIEAKIAGTEKEMYAKYNLSENQITTLNTTARLISIFTAWDESEKNNGDVDMVLEVMISAFNDSDAKETMSLLTTMSFYAWKFAKSQKDGA